MTRQRWRGLAALGLCLLAVAVINAVSRDDEPGMRWYTGTVGTQIVSPAFDVTVHKVELARTVTDERNELTTPGVLVVVHWSVDAKGEKASLSDIELLTGTGLVVSQRSDLAIYAGVKATAAGFTTTGSSVFEVHVEDLPDSAMRIEGNRGMFYTFGGGVEIRDLVAPDAKILERVTLADARTEVTP